MNPEWYALPPPFAIPKPLIGHLGADHNVCRVSTPRRPCRLSSSTDRLPRVLVSYLPGVLIAAVQIRLPLQAPPHR